MSFLTRFLFAGASTLVLWRPIAGAPALDQRAPLDHRMDVAVIDRALASARPSDPWVTFGDVGIKYADLQAYRDRLSGEFSTPTVFAVTPAGTTFKWPGGNVYYRFDPAQIGDGTITPLKMQQFRDGVAEWAAFANLHFIENVVGQPHYVTVQEDAGLGGGFSSSVGMDPANAEQFVRFGPAAWNRGTVCHEVGHALGLWHEQQRPDRDSYVVINWTHIDPLLQPNFAIVGDGATHGTAYDFYSVMHYKRNDLSNDGQDTISMQPAYAAYIDVIGKVYDRTLSKIERAGMAAVYGNPASPPSAVVTNTSDSGPGSLRTAIYYAFDRSTDAPAVPTTITFHIPTSDPNYASGTGVFTIKPTFMLTALGNGTTIDGASQTAFTGDTNPNGPEIALDGSTFALLQGPFGIFAPGLTLRAANCAVKGLTIANFNQSGIVLFQGTDPSGSAATGNVIGGTTASARNVISGNAEYGIGIHDATTTGNVIAGNYIGTTQTGSVAQANGYAGVVIYLGAHGNTVGGTTPGAGNVLSGNTYQGIFIGDAGSNGNVVQGNLIGTDATGTAPVPNAVGVEITAGAQSNSIGGVSAAARNVISGNSAAGVQIHEYNDLTQIGTRNNLVQGNYIGLDRSGSAALPNQGAGVEIFEGAPSNTIGGTAPGARNVISGNAYAGVTIDGPATSLNLVQGNFIGLDKNGTAAIANGSAGVSIYNGAHDNTVGGAGAGNVISGNAYQGVTIDGAATASNVVAGNYFGLDATGTAKIGNNSSGLSIFNGAHDNTIGGTSAGSRNFICGSTYYGISIDGAGTHANLVQGNTIGLNVAGAPIANAFQGVGLFNGAQANVIGGAAIGASNVIAGNASEGVSLFDAATIRNTISRNAIFSNHFAGIALNGGSNNGQPAPALVAATLGPAGNIGGTDVGGTLTTGAANAGFRVEFFASPPGGDEGQFFVGSADVTTNGGGTATFTAPPIHLAAAVPKSYLMTATATDSNGNTSRFSATFPVGAVDGDGDGMPDAWESAHTLNPGSAADAALDSDGDGFTNLQEFKDGTDPRNPASRFMITSMDRISGNPRIGFQALAGKIYRLEYRDDPASGGWSTLVDAIVSPITATIQIVDDGASIAAKRFYRVSVGP